MYNLLISGNDDIWDSNPTKFPRERVIKKSPYTTQEIVEEFTDLSRNSIDVIKSYPCIFGREGLTGFFRIGYIKEIRLRNDLVVFRYEYDELIPPLPVEKLIDNCLSFDIQGKSEFRTTHWALKDIDLFDELTRCGFITKENAKEATEKAINQNLLKDEKGESEELVQGCVFIVHGHDELSKMEVARFVESMELNAVILHEQVSRNETIIQKFERYAAQAAFAIVLLTPDDVGYPKDSPTNAQKRARQNVIFELGYFYAALSSSKVCVLHKPEVEILNDYAGVIYTNMDKAGAWKITLAREMKASGMNIDMNKVFKN